MLTATDAGMFAADFRDQAEVWNVAEGTVQRGVSQAAPGT